jgi:CRP-like cAMP-binding protein
VDPALADRLSSVPLFADLDREHLKSVASLVEPFEAPAGHVLVQPGFVGAGMFLIEDGTAVLSVHDRQVELGAGEIVGELALLDDRKLHTARVRTKTAVSGYCITRDAFAELLHDEPKIAIPMLKVLAKRLVDEITHH